MRDWKQEYRTSEQRGELPGRLERQRARRAMDAKGIDRSGKDVSHKKAIVKGGSNKDGVKLQSPSKNRSFRRTPGGSMK